MTTYDLVKEQIKKSPGAAAIIFGSTAISYSQLSVEIDKMSTLFKNEGIKKGDRVGVSVNRSAEMVVVLLSLMRMGATYIPLDPGFPQNRLRFIVEDSKCSHLVIENSTRSLYDYYNGTLINLENYKKVEAFEFKDEPVSEDSVVYILYTSGSTGNPKGVQIIHKSLVNFLQSMQNVPGLTKDDSLLAITTLSFDISGLELFLPLITGAQLVIASKAEALDGRMLLSLLKKNITVMQATPSTWRLLIESGWNEKLNLKALCGGEALTRELADKLLERVDSLWNMYGPTETTIWSSCAKVEPGKENLHLGRPIANTKFYIADKNNHFCAPGVPGELLIGGDGLSIGYLNRDDLTKEKFINNPFDKNQNSLVYRTGDLVKLTVDKKLEFLGRIDHQVKIRGFRIELGEIENVITQHPHVKEAVVTAYQNGKIDKRLAAYFISGSGVEINQSDLRNFISEKLPDYMIPSFFVQLEKFPLTPNAKIDRKALPLPENEKADKEDEFVSPRNTLEMQLAEIWKQVLEINQVSINDNFFEIGGHSILAAQMFNELEKLTGIRLPLVTLFEHQTISELAKLVKQDNFVEKWSPLVLIKKGNNKTPLFVIHGAEGNVLLYRELANHLDQDQPLYGLQSRGLNGTESIPASVEEMAVDYIKSIKSIQSHGPYNIGGYCMGGTIAFEVAQRLIGEGEAVNNLFLIETYNAAFGNITNTFLDRTRERLENVKFHFDNLVSLKGSDKKVFLKQKIETTTRRTKARLNAISCKVGINIEVLPENSSKTSRVRHANDIAQMNYIPNEYKGKTILLRPVISYSNEPDPKFGWGDVVKGELKVYNLDLAPRGMLVEPYVAQTAAIISREITGTK
ncbi:MAG: amino acid adenylation domain-containing protein [Ignavibacteriales bacterium]|nr:MAG: amino acid adenylation domain-containing protein [Ignavibacteriales bacterium]